MTVRPAAEADLPMIERFLLELQEHERRLHDSRRGGPEIAQLYLAEIRGKARDLSGALLVAEQDNELFGFVCCWLDSEADMLLTAAACGFGYISDLYVSPAARRRGIATAMLSAAERHLANQGAKRVRVGALAANGPACAAYEKTGFTPYETSYEKRLDR